jgi:uncharacterized protein YhdP
VGAIAIIIQQLLQAELEKTVSYQYHVTGSWQKPQIDPIPAANAVKDNVVN